MNPEIQPTRPLDLAGVAVAPPAAGLVKMKMLVCLGVAQLLIWGASQPQTPAALTEIEAAVVCLHGKSGCAGCF